SPAPAGSAAPPASTSTPPPGGASASCRAPCPGALRTAAPRRPGTRSGGGAPRLTGHPGRLLPGGVHLRPGPLLGLPGPDLGDPLPDGDLEALVHPGRVVESLQRPALDGPPHGTLDGPDLSLLLGGDQRV